MKFSEVYSEYSEEVVEHKPEGEPKKSKEQDDEVDNAARPAAVDGDSINHVLLYPFFGIEEGEIVPEKDRVKMAKLYQYASSESDDIIRYLSRLERKIGEPMMGVSRLNHLYQHVKFHGASSKKG
jgi:hypothetical protein